MAVVLVVDFQGSRSDDGMEREGKQRDLVNNKLKSRYFCAARSLIYPICDSYYGLPITMCVCVSIRQRRRRSRFIDLRYA